MRNVGFITKNKFFEGFKKILIKNGFNVYDGNDGKNEYKKLNLIIIEYFKNENYDNILNKYPGKIAFFDFDEQMIFEKIKDKRILAVINNGKYKQRTCKVLDIKEINSEINYRRMVKYVKMAIGFSNGKVVDNNA